MLGLCGLAAVGVHSGPGPWASPAGTPQAELGAWGLLVAPPSAQTHARLSGTFHARASALPSECSSGRGHYPCVQLRRGPQLVYPPLWGVPGASKVPVAATGTWGP